MVHFLNLIYSMELGDLVKNKNGNNLSYELI